MTAYEPGDVILVPFPFGQRAGGRKRPALIISGTDYNRGTGQVVIAQVTGRVSGSSRVGDCLIQDWSAAGLLGPSIVRARVATVESGLVLRKLGALTPDDLAAVLAAVQSVLVQVMPGPPPLADTPVADL